jgi:tRNA nucleotidyltransferase/poly(A) polymerase
MNDHPAPDLHDLEQSVLAWLAQRPEPAYLVGGSVRDRLLNRPVHDLDLAIDGDGLALARRLANHFRGAYHPLDVDRSVGRAILRAAGSLNLVVDVAAFRRPDPSASSPSGRSLTADLADRDFTINAMAADVRTPDDVIDLHGGADHLHARLIYPVSEASIRNDPLRALRAIRQAAQLGFSLAPETEALICRDAGGLARVSSERIRDELAHLLALPGAAHFLDLADALGLLTTILPELEPLRNLAQPPPHYLRALTHSLETVRCLEALLAGLDAPGGEGDAAASSGRVPCPVPAPLHPFAGRIRAHLGRTLGADRPGLVTFKLAALLHDTGKPAARTTDDDGRIRFIGHQGGSATITGDVMRRLRFNNSEVRLGETIARHHMRPLLLSLQSSVSARAVYRFFRDTGDAGVQVLLHALADHQAIFSPGAENDRWPRLVALVARMLEDYWERGEKTVAPPALISGGDLLRELQLQSGPHIGELLEAVREAQVSGEVRTREQALALAREVWSKGL